MVTAGAEFLGICETIVQEHTWQEVDGVEVDVQSARAVLDVHAALSPRHQEQFLGLDGPAEVVDLAWRLVASARAD